jgi:hypothetical protein
MNKTIVVLLFLIFSFAHLSAQDNLHSHLENGKFYGIFPVAENYVCYTDSLVFTGSINKDSLFDRAKAFFDQKEDAKYYFESEDKEAGELIYQGKLNKSIYSQNSDIHFTIDFHFVDSGCIVKLFEVVMATPHDQYDPVFKNGPGHTVTGRKINYDLKAAELENITIGKGEFSRKYCEELDNRFISIMNRVKSIFEKN